MLLEPKTHVPPADFADEGRSSYALKIASAVLTKDKASLYLLTDHLTKR